MHFYDERYKADMKATKVALKEICTCLWSLCWLGWLWDCCCVVEEEEEDEIAMSESVAADFRAGSGQGEVIGVGDGATSVGSRYHFAY